MKGLVLALLAAMGCQTPDCEERWTSLTDDLDRAVLAVWGRSSTDVTLVGGGLGVPGKGALVLHHDGRTWTELPTGRTETLWWVWGTPDGEHLWMVGEEGLVLHRHGDALSVVPSETTATLYGVWGSADDDVWIVGGTPGAGTSAENDVVLHWNGRTLEPDRTLPALGVALFKVWGAGKGDVWVTGERSRILRRTNGAWQDHSGAPFDGTSSLFTVTGCSAREVYTVGGQAIYRFDGTAWAALEVPGALSGVNGVACGEATVLAVGNGGLKLRLARDTGDWTSDQLEDPWDTDFHGAWVSPDGDLWAVGGNFIAPSALVDRRVGVVAHHGCTSPPVIFPP